MAEKLFEELFRIPIEDAKVENFTDFFPMQPYLMLPSKSGYPSLTMVRNEDFETYCADLRAKWGAGDLVVTRNCSVTSIEFHNPDFRAMRNKWGEEIEAYYASKPSGSYVGD